MNVFDFAIDLERSGRQFFQKLAEKSEHEGVRTIFAMMAEDEQELLEKFQAMRVSTQASTMEDSWALEYAKNVFQEGLNEYEALQIDNSLEAYNYVMKVEKDIYSLYLKAAERETNGDVKGLLLKIAEEERRELDNIRRVYDFVNAPNEFLAWGEFSNLGEFYNFGRDEG
ncbi:MAG: ferritin [Desulfuromonas sp.]|uniref:ferritin-like domain-containing protein n=1 Tax=Desulfuromonas sp. TaxID=892 RepID=UPI000CB660E1|nr:ferritin family protein [Desulfuromonas sp.]PLX83633.1 MAG: ferritin [Desulfuromonas sp.]